jgi:hypothetical protein
MTEIEPYAGGSQIITRHDLRNSATDSWTDVLEEIGDLASRIAGTDFVPASFKDSVPAVAATILTGRELGFAPMTALASLHSIKGKVGLTAEAMRALVLQAGHEIVTTTSTASQCTMKGRRKGSTEWTEVTWTSSDARAAKLAGENWTKYPRQMLQARASTELCRLAFPDVIRGLASLEEITDYDVIPGGAPAPAGDESEATKPAPVKRAARKRAAAPKAEPADPPALPDGDTAEAPEAPAQADEPPPPDLPDSSPSAEPESADVDEEPHPRDAHPGDSAGEAPAEGEAPDLPEPDPDVEDVAGEFDRMPINQGQKSLVMIHFNRLGIKDRDERLMMTCAVIGRIIESANELTFKEATALLHVLETSKDAAALAALIEATTDDGA